MSGKISKVLFFADGARGESGALRRACEFAAYYQAELIVVGVVQAVSTSDARLQRSIDRIQKTLITDRGIELDSLIASIKTDRARGTEIRKLVLPGKDYIEVIRAAVNEKADLVIKSANSTNAVQKVLFGDADVRLMHFSPCPVMVLKPTRKRSIKKVAIAIDPAMDNREVANLNARILEAGIGAAETGDAGIHLVYVLEHPLEDQKKQHQDAYRQLEQSLKEEAQRKLGKISAASGHLNLTEHVLKGKPHSAIAKFVAKQEIDLLVMGSVARSGLPGLLVGNTAERIVSQVDCSVMVVKPDGWVSPVL